MQSLPRSPFDVAINLEISNDPGDAAEHFDRFFRAEGQRFKVAAAYTEMNGFDINQDLWYCDLFAYASYSGHDDYEWLCNPPSQPFKEYVIKRLETVQAAYESDAFHDERLRGGAEMCGPKALTNHPKSEATRSWPSLPQPYNTAGSPNDFHRCLRATPTWSGRITRRERLTAISIIGIMKFDLIAGRVDGPDVT